MYPEYPVFLTYLVLCVVHIWLFVPRYLGNIKCTSLSMFNTHVLYLLILHLPHPVNSAYKKQVVCLLATNLYLKIFNVKPVFISSLIYLVELRFSKQMHISKAACKMTS